MRAERIDSMFNYRFEKSSAEIIDKGNLKVNQIKAKMEERAKRIREVRSEYKITEAVLVDLLQQARAAGGSQRMSFSTNARDARGGLTEETITVGAGVVNMILTEQDFIDAERASIERLSLVVRNLKDLPDQTGAVRGHGMSFDELKFLGF